MKFTALMIDIISIQHFLKILSSVGKLAKTVILRINSSHLYLIMNEHGTVGTCNLWCEILQDHFFSEFRMGGISEENNEIYLKLLTENLVRAYKSSQAAKSVRLKLTKKHVPCLTMEVELPSLHSYSRVVVHDIPVTIIPFRDWDEFQEPNMPSYDISLYLPSLRTMKNVVERMKNLSTYVVITANKEGSLSLKVETDIVSIATHFKDLESPVAGQRATDDENLTWAEIRVDIRKLNQFLFGKQINPMRAVCNIVHSQMLHLFLLHDDVTLQYFLPNIAS